MPKDFVISAPDSAIHLVIHLALESFNMLLEIGGPMGSLETNDVSTATSCRLLLTLSLDLVGCSLNVDP